MRRTIALLLGSLALGVAAVASASDDYDEDPRCGSPAIATGDSACSGPLTECQEVSDDDWGRLARCAPEDAATAQCEVEEAMPAELEAAAEDARARLAADDDHETIKL